MGILDLFKREEPTPVVTPPIVDDVLLQALLGGETIDRKKAMTIPAVAGAVDFISNAVACMPVKLYKETDGKVDEVKDDTRTKLLNGDTGDTLDAYQMKKALVADYLMGKGGYCYIRRKRNEVTGLFYVEDLYITILRTPEPIYKKYQIEVEGKPYRPWDFIKLLRNTKDGASGEGLTVEISKELETAYQTLLYELGMVKSGGNKRGFLKADRRLGQDEIDVLKQAWRNMYGNNTESVVVLNNGLQFQEASNSSVEMQMNESKRTLADEINGLFHIYPSDFDRTFKEAIYPVIKAFETALNRDLLLEKEKADHFFEFDVKEIIKATLNERYQAYKTAKETGFLTINEIRRAENLNWIEGLDVVNVGLGAVLYDVEEQKFFTPNTGEATDIETASATAQEDKMVENHELAQAFDESGNSAERELRFNPNHDPKSGRFSTADGGLRSIVASQTWEEYLGNAKKKEVVAMMKDAGILKNAQTIRDYWVQTKQEDFTEADLKEITLDEARDIITSHMPPEMLKGWFVDANSDWKPRIENVILENKDVRNAGLNVAYHNSKFYDPDLDFNTFVNKERTVYRGEKYGGIDKIDSDVFVSYSPDKNVAQRFGKTISEMTIKPIETYGSYQDNAEFEYLIPLSKLNNRELRFNENHDPKTGRFTTGNGGSGASGATATFTDSKGNTLRFTRQSGAEFLDALKKAKESQLPNNRWRVDDESHDAKEYDGMKCFTSENGSTVAIKESGDIVSVCSRINEDGTKDNARTLMEFAVEQGGDRLDSYDGNFGFYTHVGFEPVSWTPFDEKYAPTGWEKQRDNAEPVVFFKYSGKIDTIDRDTFLSDVPASGDYDLAEAMRNEAMDK